MKNGLVTLLVAVILVAAPVLGGRAVHTSREECVSIIAARAGACVSGNDDDVGRALAELTGIGRVKGQLSLDGRGGQRVVSSRRRRWIFRLRDDHLVVEAMSGVVLSVDPDIRGFRVTLLDSTGSVRWSDEELVGAWTDTLKVELNEEPTPELVLTLVDWRQRVYRVEEKRLVFLREDNGH